MTSEPSTAAFSSYTYEDLQDRDSGVTLFQRFMMLVLWIVTLLSIVLCIWLIIRSTGQENAQSVVPQFDPNKGKGTQVPKQSGVCGTEDCQYMKWLIGVSLNSKKDPCRNFYEYVCSGIANRYPSWFGSHGSQGGMLGAVEANLTASIDDHLSRSVAPIIGQTAFQKAVAFYQMCMRQKNTDLEDTMMHNFLSEYGMTLQKVPGFQPLYAFVKLLFKTHAFIVFALKMVVEPGSQNYVLNFSRSDDFVLWRERRSELLVRNQYRDYIREALAHVTEPTDEKVDRFINAEAAVIALSEAEHPRGRERERLPLSRLGLWRNDSGFSAEWTRLLGRVSFGELPGSLTVSAERRDLEFFHDLFGNSDKINVTDVRSYMTWAVLNHLARTARMTKVDPENDCKRQVMSFFPFATLSAVLFKTVNETRVGHVKMMSSTIVEQIRTSFRNTKWWDAPTMEAALKKLDKFSTYYAFPPGMTDPEGVEEYYAKFVDIRDSYLRSYILTSSVHAAYNTYLLTSSNATSINNDVVLRQTHRASTVYLPSFNALYIRAGVMYTPVYSFGAPPEVNYGALGRLIASAVMLGFNGSGRKLDGSGRPVNWWTRPSEEAFLQREKCAQNSYGNASNGGTSQTIPTAHVTDIMAEESVYNAYKEASKTDDNSLGNVGPLTRDQLFYVSWCLMFCGAGSATDPSLERRCNAPLINSGRFAKAFSCPLGASMNPKQKCHFW